MKFPLTIFLLFYGFHAFSQSCDPDVKQFYSNLLDHLDEDDILLDLTPYSEFLKTKKSSLLSDRQLFRKKLLLSNTCSPFRTLPSLDSLDVLSSEYKDRHLQPLGLLHLHAKELDSSFIQSASFGIDTPSKSLIFNNSDLQYLNNRSISAFSGFDEITSTSAQFIFPSSLIVSDTTPHNIRINFGDGRGYKTVKLDSIYTIDYTHLDLTEGPVKVSIEISYFLGSKRYYNKTEVYAYQESIPDQRIYVSDISSQNLCSFLSETEFGEAEVNIRYGKAQANAKVIKKPFILIEGFDFDLNPTDDHYGDLNYTTVIQGITFSEVTGYPIKTNLADLAVFTERLYQESYDLVFVNFKDGSADLFKNGNSLIRIIQWVNETKVSNEELMLFGASMGGLLARYALKKMELEGCSHCTKLYGSFDSPHQGATISLGLQYTIDHLNQKGFDTEYGYRALSSAAAKQMLIHNIIPGASTLRSQWQSWLDENGYPALPKLVSITNGSPNGVIPYKEGQGLYGNCYKTKGVELFKILLLAEKPSARAAYIKLPKGNSTFSKYMNALFNNYDIGDYSYPKDLTYYDHSSGGQAPWLYQAHLLIQSYVNGYKNNTCRGPSLTNNGLTTFIPTFSALDLNRKVIDPKLVYLFPRFPIDMTSRLSTLHPFHSIHYHSSKEPGKSENQEHVLVDADANQNVDWIFQQIYSVSSSLPSLLPYSNAERVFNLSNEEEFELVVSDLSIIKDGILILNGNRKMNFGSSIDRHPLNPYKKQLFRSNSCGALIKIHSDGLLQIGDDPTTNGNISSEFRLVKGSTLELFDGGRLVLKEGSKLIIEPGAQLIYHPGATIQLDGPNAILEIRGTIQLLDNSELELVRNLNNKNGYIILDNSISPNHQNILAGSNCSIILEGQNRNERLLELRGYMHAFPNALSEIIMNKGEVFIKKSSGLEISSECTLKELLLKGNGLTEKGTGLHITPQDNQLLDKLWFSDLSTGCMVESSPKTFNITNSNFGTCSDGLVLFNDASSIWNTGFNQCNNAILTVQSKELELNQCKFKNNTNGILDLSTKSHNIKIQESHFESNLYGLQIKSASTCFLTCTNFIKNQTAVSCDGSSLYLTPINPQSVSAGSNSFIENHQAIKGYGELHLEDGNNNFIKTPSNAVPFIEMTVRNTCSCIQGTRAIKAEQNFWNPQPLAGQLGGLQPKVYEITVGTPSAYANGELFGNTLSSANTFCPNFYSNPELSKLYKAEKISNGYSLEVLAYPNPFEKTIHVQISGATLDQAFIEVYSVKGQLMFKKTYSIDEDKPLSIDLEWLPPGIYYLSIKTDYHETKELLIKN